jgi:hypothetical protein
MISLQIGKCHQELLEPLLPRGESVLLTELEDILAGSVLGHRPLIQMRIKQALALSHYLKQEDFPVVKWLLSDDAGEYTKIATKGQALCWVHDGRYYRKLIPSGLSMFNFRVEYWWVFPAIKALKPESSRS